VDADAGSPSATLSGRGLHSGRAAEVKLVRTSPSDPVVFRTSQGDASLSELEIVRADQGVRVRATRTGLDVDGVEHLLAALGGLSIRSGIALRVDGGELPLLDGAALAFARALMGLGPSTGAPNVRVARAGTVRVGASSYVFSPGKTMVLDAEIAFAAPRIGVQRARWYGDAETFVCDLAWARTFGFRRDAARLGAAGRGLGADPRSVMVLEDDGRVAPPGAPARPDEFARHKLLDLIGDLYLFGGPPRGHVRAHRPGHAATHRAMREALERGIVVKA